MNQVLPLLLKDTDRLLMLSNIFFGGVFVYQQLVAISMLVLKAILRCISSLCVQVLVQLIESRTTGFIHSWEDCFLTVLQRLYL